MHFKFLNSVVHPYKVGKTTPRIIAIEFYTNVSEQRDMSEHMYFVRWEIVHFAFETIINGKLFISSLRSLL